MNWSAASSLALAGTRIRRASWRRWLSFAEGFWWITRITNPRTLAEADPQVVTGTTAGATATGLEVTAADLAAGDWITDSLLPVPFSSTKSSTATCPVGYFGEFTAVETRTSDYSQEEADTLAQAAADAAAEAGLVCLLIYTSTQSYTATCPLGYSGGSYTATATRESLVSQADADALALAAATAGANAALTCTPFSFPATLQITFQRVTNYYFSATLFDVTGTLVRGTTSTGRVTYTCATQTMTPHAGGASTSLSLGITLDFTDHAIGGSGIPPWQWSLKITDSFFAETKESTLANTVGSVPNAAGSYANMSWSSIGGYTANITALAIS